MFLRTLFKLQIELGWLR